MKTHVPFRNTGLRAATLFNIGLIALFVLGRESVRAQITIAVNPANTFLRTGGSFFSDPNAGATVPIDLESLGINGGDAIRLERLGDYWNGAPGQGDTVTGMHAVFSASDSLLPATEQNRVVDALDACAPDFVSGHTAGDTLPTNDIPEDFRISPTFFGPPVSSIAVKVPSAAKFLFVAAEDIFWGDNVDLDWDFAVRITNLGDPLQLIENLIFTVAALNLQVGIENSLDAKLDAALNALDDVNAGNDAGAISSLEAFVHEVEAQSGKKISTTDAEALIEAAREIISVLGC